MTVRAPVGFEPPSDSGTAEGASALSLLMSPKSVRGRKRARGRVVKGNCKGLSSADDHGSALRVDCQTGDFIAKAAAQERGIQKSGTRRVELHYE